MATIIKKPLVKGIAKHLAKEGIIEPHQLDQKNAAQLHDQLKVCLENYIQVLKAGYHDVLSQVEQNFGSRIVEDYKLSLDQMSKLISEKSGIGDSLPSYLGYTDQMMEEIFVIAFNHKEHREWEKAIGVFIFLLFLEPYHAFCWQGLGDCWSQNEQWDAALHAYGIAINCAPLELDLYRSACNCLLKMKEYGKARDILQYGLENFRGARQKQTTREAIDHLDAAIAYIDSIKHKK